MDIYLYQNEEEYISFNKSMSEIFNIEYIHQKYNSEDYKFTNTDINSGWEWKGKTRSDETKKLWSDTRKGKKQSKEHILKKSYSKAKEYIITDPQGNKHNIRNLKEYCRENGLNAGNMVRVLNGTRNHHKNYTIIRK